MIKYQSNFAMKNSNDLLSFDANHLWHPYTSAINPQKTLLVKKAHGSRIILADGTELIDGMSSWWAAIHGYNHPKLNQAIKRQINKVSHIMFGGLTHKPAIELGKRLLQIVPNGLEHIFYADSGSVAVEVALKMAIQYQQAKGNKKRNRFLSFQKGYHGDTLHAMSVCDPVTGMHTLFKETLPLQFFGESFSVPFHEKLALTDIQKMEKLFSRVHKECAACIVEPIVQGAGGMNFYSPEYLPLLKRLCEKYKMLLIFDEIATGFGRTGKMFAAEHANITPDIMCLGKAITGGGLSFAATLATKEVAETISLGTPSVFMHGPTFMGNPLACAVAIQNLKLLSNNKWQEDVAFIENYFLKELTQAELSPHVKEVRVLGAIGVIELHQNIDPGAITDLLLKYKIWVRPFNKLLYLMPPYNIPKEDLKQLVSGTLSLLHDYFNGNLHEQL